MPFAVSVLVALSLSTSVIGGCGHSDCSCLPAHGLDIEAPANVIRAVKTSGAACTDAQLSCPESGSVAYPMGCARTVLSARRGGPCEVEVDFTNGQVFKRTVTLVEGAAGCCGSSITAANPNDATIDLSGALDAGGDAHD